MIYGIQKYSPTSARASKATVSKNVQGINSPVAMAFSVDHYALCGRLWNDTLYVFIETKKNFTGINIYAIWNHKHTHKKHKFWTKHSWLVWG